MLGHYADLRLEYVLCQLEVGRHFGIVGVPATFEAVCDLLATLRLSATRRMYNVRD